MTRDTQTDQDVIDACLGGRQDEYRVLIDRYQGKVFNLLMRILRNRERAEEVTQDAFLQAYLKLASYDSQYRFSSWLLKIAQNLAFNQLRKARLETVSIDGDRDSNRTVRAIADEKSEGQPEERAERRDLKRILEASFDILSSKYRATVVLRHTEGLSYKEIADVLDIPVGTVKFRLHRAYRLLKEKLERREVLA